jgi:hypothetical protein
MRAKLMRLGAICCVGLRTGHRSPSIAGRVIVPAHRALGISSSFVRGKSLISQGLDTPVPFIKLGNQVYQGEMSPLIGDEVILGMVRSASLFHLLALSWLIPRSRQPDTAIPSPSSYGQASPFLPTHHPPSQRARTSPNDAQEALRRQHTRACANDRRARGAAETGTAERLFEPSPDGFRDRR